MDGMLIGTEIVLGLIIGGIGYFVKVLHNDVRQNTREVGEVKGHIDNLTTRIDHESEMRNTALKNIMTILQEIKEELKEIRK